MYIERGVILLKLCIALTLLAISGCNLTEAGEVEKAVFYENVEAGLKIYESSDWTLDSEVSIEPFNATFKQGNVRAIVSIIPSVKTLDQIKQELHLDRDFVEVIEESDHRLSFQTNQKESIRSDIYAQQTDGETLILTFLTSIAEYEANQEKMEEFRNNIERTY